VRKTGNSGFTNGTGGTTTSGTTKSSTTTTGAVASSSLHPRLLSKSWICSMEPKEREKHIMFVVTDGGAIYQKSVPLDELREMKHALEKGEGTIPWWQFFSSMLHSFRKKKLSCYFVAQDGVHMNQSLNGAGEAKRGGVADNAASHLCKLAMELHFPTVGRTIVTLNLRELPQKKIPKVLRDTYLIPLFDFYRLRVSNKYVNLANDNGDDDDDATKDLQKQLKLEREKNTALQQEIAQLKKRLNNGGILSHAESSIHLQDVRSSRSLVRASSNNTNGDDSQGDEQGFGMFPADLINRYIRDFRNRLIDRSILSSAQMDEFEKTVSLLSRNRTLLQDTPEEEADANIEVLNWIKNKFSKKKRKTRKRHSDQPQIEDVMSGANSGLTTKAQEAMAAMFERIDEWNFDTFTLDKLSDGRPLFVTGFTLFVKHDLINKFNIPESNLRNFLREIESGYHPNPYHNNLHACDVTQVLHVIISTGNLNQYLSQEDIFAALFAAMVHDLDHPGLNNAFQVHSQSYLATLYNDRSVLENHHIAHAFELTRLKPYNIFSGLTTAQRNDIRETTIGMVLSTDMSNHSKYVNKFKLRLEADADFTAKEDVRLALQIAIKTADVSNPSRPINIYLQWTEKIMEEFFAQGDCEREHGMQISPLMDRKTAEIGRGQQAFMTFVIQPLFQSLTLLLPKMKFVEDYIGENLRYWSHHDAIEWGQQLKKE